MCLYERKDKYGKMIIRSKLQKAGAPRFAKKILRRLRVQRSSSEHPDSVTWNELKVLGRFGSKLKGGATSVVEEKRNRKVQSKEGGRKR
jgi:hypothetical protein